MHHYKIVTNALSYLVWVLQLIQTCTCLVLPTTYAVGSTYVQAWHFKQSQLPLMLYSYLAGLSKN